jgi:hypothetical protein
MPAGLFADRRSDVIRVEAGRRNRPPTRNFSRSSRKDVVMTATKAVAGGIAGNLVTLALWAISTIPGWNRVPDQPKAAILALVSAAVAAGIVYFAPSNKETQSEAAPAAPVQLREVA